MWSCSAQMPVAVVGDVRWISGMWPWCTVTASASVSERNAHERVGAGDDATARVCRVHHDIVGEHLAHAGPVLGVHRSEVARLQLLDRLEVIHVRAIPAAQE